MTATLYCAELVSSPHYEPLTKPALCLFPELLNSSQRCVLRAIFTNDFARAAVFGVPAQRGLSWVPIFYTAERLCELAKLGWYLNTFRR